jgi:putative DNA primase/helicase
MKYDDWEIDEEGRIPCARPLDLTKLRRPESNTTEAPAEIAPPQEPEARPHSRVAKAEGSRASAFAGYERVRPPREDKRGTGRPNEIVTEDSAALEFARIYGGRLRFDHDAGQWREWSGSVWRESKTGLAFHFARNLARDLAVEEPDKVRYITGKTSFAVGVERFARADPVFATTSEFWDRDTMLLGTPEGVVDLRTGRQRASKPEDGITKTTAISPSRNADCPLWMRFLQETTGGDAEMVRFLKQWSGYCLTGDTREHALVFVFGPGGNGKSVFLNALTGILGDYAVTATMDAFIASHGDRHSTDLAMLRGARLVTSSETEEGRPWAEARIKQVTGGDAISARFMRQDNFTYRPQFKLTIVGNHKPVLRTVDDAQRRRFNLVPFMHKPPAPDRELEQKLKSEWPAILRWAIEGCLDWQANGLVRPSSVVKATSDYFSDQDLLGQWLTDECDAEPGNRWKVAASAALFASWSTYAIRAGEKLGSRKSFAEELERRGFEKRKGSGGVREFLGLRLKPASGASGA